MGMDEAASPLRHRSMDERKATVTDQADSAALSARAESAERRANLSMGMVVKLAERIRALERRIDALELRVDGEARYDDASTPV